MKFTDHNIGGKLTGIMIQDHHTSGFAHNEVYAIVKVEFHVLCQLKQYVKDKGRLFVLPGCVRLNYCLSIKDDGVIAMGLAFGLP